jgi:hypothetical protein
MSRVSGLSPESRDPDPRQVQANLLTATQPQRGTVSDQQLGDADAEHESVKRAADGTTNSRRRP